MMTDNREPTTTGFIIARPHDATDDPRIPAVRVAEASFALVNQVIGSTSTPVEAVATLMVTMRAMCNIVCSEPAIVDRLLREADEMSNEIDLDLHFVRAPGGQVGEA